MSYEDHDDVYPEDADLDEHGEGDGAEPDADYYWHDDPWGDVEPDDPNCLGPGCYDSDTDWRGRRCRMCNPTPWQARRAEWTWSATAPWRWVRRKVRARMRPGDYAEFPPF